MWAMSMSSCLTHPLGVHRHAGARREGEDEFDGGRDLYFHTQMWVFVVGSPSYVHASSGAP